jgi:hypothetical protein
MPSQMEHLDSAETVFFLRELMQIAAESYDVKYAKLKGAQNVPFRTDIDAAAETYLYRQFNSVGKAERVKGPDDKLPLVNTLGKEFTHKLAIYGTGFAYSVDEIRAGAKAGRPLDRMRAQVARKVIDQKIDDICFQGDADVGTLGLNTLTNVLDYTGSLDTSGSGSPNTLWSGKSADAILKDMNGLVTKIVHDTLEVESPTRILLPTNQYRQISTTARSTVSDTTILEFFQANNPDISVSSWERLGGAGSEAKDRMIGYDPQMMNLHLLMAIPYEQLAPQLDGWFYKVNVRCKLGGVVAPYPQSVCIADGI